MVRKSVIFTGHQSLSLAQGIRNYIAKSGITVWACAIMPDHMHLVIARHTYIIERISNLVKGEMSKQLVADDRHPFSNETYQGGMIPSCFGRKSWHVFIDNEPHIVNTIDYVERNPEKAGLKRQHWNFVLPYPQRYSKAV